MTAAVKEHNLGLKGRFGIPEHLRKTADICGLSIAHLGEGKYAVSAADSAFDFDKFIPSFVTRAGNSFDLPNLNAFLSFLHQPLKAGTERASNVVPLSGKKSEIAVQRHHERVAVHRILRFATTGSVEIPPDVNEELQKANAECHAKTEQAMRDADAWESQPEIGNPQAVQSAVPGTGIDPARGFSFTIKPAADKGAAQKEMRTHLLAAVNTATGGRYTEDAATIHLSAAELESFCREVRKCPPDLVNRVEFEEEVQLHMAGIERRAQDLSSSGAFRRLSADETGSKQKLGNLMRCTSALTPVISSQAMRDVWTRYHFADRHESPLQGLTKEMAVFIAVMDVYARQPDVTPLQLEAIAQEFYPLLAFSGKIADSLGQGFENAGQADLSRRFMDMSAAIRNGSLGGVNLEPGFMADKYGDVIAGVQAYTHTGGSALVDAVVAPAEAGWGFVKDMTTFVAESPKVAAGFVVLATTLYMMSGGDQDTAQAANNSVMVFGEQGLQPTAIDMSQLPEEARQVQNWHWDMGVFGLYKHFMFDNAIVGPVQTILDWTRMGVHWGYEHLGVPINMASNFSKTATDVVQPIANQWFKFNIFQNASHAAFWMYMAARGYNHRFKGAKRIFELLSPVTDIGFRLGLASAEKLHLKGGGDLSARLMRLTRENAPGALPRYDGSFEPAALKTECSACGHCGTCLLKPYAIAAQARVELEETLSENITPADLTLKIGGLTKQFRISAENLAPTLKALDQFDMVMEHAAAQLGINEPWYLRYLGQRVRAVTRALRDFAEDGNAPALQRALDRNLQELAGAQIRYSGTSPIYEALLGEAPEEAVMKDLSWEADAKFGKLQRAGRLQEGHARIRGEEGASLTFGGHVKERAIMMGTALWGGIVGAARVVGKNGGKLIKNRPAVIAAAGITAAAVALDLAGKGNGVTNALSGGAGAAVSATLTTGAFLLYNFWEDILGVHVGSGAGLIAAGAAAGYAYKRIIKPSSLSLTDGIYMATGLDLEKGWKKAASCAESVKAGLSRRVEGFNREAGQALTERAVREAPVRVQRRVSQPDREMAAPGL